MKKSREIRVLIPDEYYQIIKFKQEGKYGIAVINTAIQSEELIEVFYWNCSILIELKNSTENGLPSKEESEILVDFEEYLNKNINGVSEEKPNALFYGRITWNSTRQLIWKVHNPKITNDFLQELIESGNYAFEFDYRIEDDRNWEITKWYNENIKV